MKKIKPAAVQKHTARLKSKFLGNERGLLSVDYLFSFVMVFGFTLLLLAISLSLSVVEVAQYISFSAARAYYASHFDEQKQKALGQAKLNELLSHQAVKALYQKSGLFTITQKRVDRHDDKWQLKQSDRDEEINLFQGAELELNLKALNFSLPGLGSTSREGQGFKARVASYLSREPTYQECRDFIQQRWQKIQHAIVQDQNIKFITPPHYTGIIDNGC